MQVTDGRTGQGVHVDPRMKWCGWGSEGARYPLPSGAQAHLAEQFGVTSGDRISRPESIDAVTIPQSRLSEAALGPLTQELGPEAVRTDHSMRVQHSVGRSYRDLLRLRAARLPRAVDAVLYPGTGEELRRIIAMAADQDWALIPFGGGTSVVGGVEPPAVERPVVSVDMARLSRCINIDPRSRLATFEAGVFGPDLEAALAPHGLTLGHFPQSFEFSTLGGWVATRSAGQASTGRGRIDDLVHHLVLDAPSATVAAGGFPASAAGPDLSRLMIGSEGRLGIIREVTVRLHQTPEETPVRALLFRDFAHGWDALQELTGHPHPPTVLRLSDVEETELMATLSAPESVTSKLLHGVGRRYLAGRGRPIPGSCLMLLTFEGPRPDATRGMKSALRVLRRAGGLDVGAAPARRWRSERFRHPYLRDELMDLGLLVDTLETCTTWSQMGELYGAVKEALRTSIEASGSPSAVMCHVSHLYGDGASLYFTFFGRRDTENPEGQWDRIKRAASDAIAASGGTITHHHAIGYEHAPWLEAEVGSDTLGLLRSAARTLDPAGVMNPGKLLD